MEKKEKLLRTLLTAATVLLLVLLAWQCLDIYLTGNSPANLDESGLHIHSVYRAEDVIARLSGLRLWAVCYLALLVAACVMVPGGAGKGNGVPMEPENRLRLMKKKIAELPENARSEEILRKKICYATAAVVVLCAALSLVFLLNRDNFTSWDLEMVMGQMLVHILPWIILAVAAVIAASFFCRRSMEREIALLKGVSGNKTPEAAEKPSRVLYVRIALYALAAILIVLGINNGGMRDVLVKAINICTECIGLG
jgi:uncharacterized membrane protein